MYDAQLQHAQRVLDVPIWDTVKAEDLEPSDGEEGLLSYACRCGGVYRLLVADLVGQSRVVLPCDTCSLYIEIPSSGPSTDVNHQS